MARKRQFDKQAVLEKAMFLFWEKGFEATSVHDLKRAMGISTSSMYETFGDKRGIFLESLAHFCQLERKQFSELARETASAIQLVERLFDSVDMIVQDSGDRHGSFAFNAMVEFGTRDAAVTGLIFDHYFAIAEIIAAVLSQAQTLGSISTQHDPLDLAHLILSTLYGVAAVKDAKPGYGYTEPVKQIIVSLLQP